MFAIILALILAIATPCPSEDSNFCHWDASRRGNGIGISFFTLFDQTFYL